MSENIETTEVVIVGGGQAGIAASEHLTNYGIPHVVIEKNRIAERWRSERWDSLVANGPAWHDRFPNMEFEGIEPDAFASKEQVAQYLTDYAKRFNAPIREGVEVKSAVKKADEYGWLVETTDGTIEANHIIAATGPFHTPVYPNIVPADAGIHQMHSSAYKNPEQLPEGNVLVVGAGSSGVQIADEIRDAGREVYLSVGPHDRPPRSYRNRDFCWWLGVLNKWDMVTPPEGADHVTIAVSGAKGGHTVDMRNLAAKGITLVGRTNEYRDGKLIFGQDLVKNVNRGDELYLGLLREADEYVEWNGLELPEEPEAHVIGEDPECMKNPLADLDLQEAGITTIIWSTGFTVDYQWLQTDCFDEKGLPDQKRGVSSVPGVYFLGLPWQSRRGSSFIWGVWHDAKYVADQINIKINYANYVPGAEHAPSGTTTHTSTPVHA